MSKVVQITDENFEQEVLESDIPTEVDFWAPWCGPCKMVIPIYEKLSEEYEGRFKFCMINVDENQRTAAKYQIMSIPMQKYFANGEAVDEILGAVPEGTIRAMVEDILKRFPSDETGKLKLLLTSWVEHNQKHSEKFSKWAEKANNLEGNSIYKSALQAAQEVEKANEQLSQVLMQLPSDKETVTGSISEQEIRRALAEVNHPEIARTLVDLGMLKDITFDGGNVSLTLALPLMGIPTQVKDYLLNSIRQALANLDTSLKTEINLAEMNPEERAKFLDMEQEGWIG
jgi:thioredoxin 1